MYYGTVARYKLKAGQEDAFLAKMASFESSPPPGWFYTTLFRSTGDPNEIWMSTVFESEEAYKANAQSPEMDKMYRALLEDLESEPEWHDGHVIHEAMHSA
ncbi:MAG TPA: antibiotic biosynthesis monooxygenase family protein [Candidatus Dormibacteraeota bacterium]|jgi:quinol monooxygenase YgiN|nr:antibiotic biosynthesis monooxygenase family protein [Candidatus Dormibacteraeota bacterium]